MSKIDRYDNIECSIEDGILTMRVCVNETEVDVQPSKSGKTLVMATTGGAMRVAGSGIPPLLLNLTLYRKP